MSGTIEIDCPFCGSTNRIDFEDWRGASSFRCDECATEVDLPEDEAGRLRKAA